MLHFSFMGCHFLCLIVWFAFVIAPPPVPGQAAKEPAKANSQANGRSSNKQVPSPAPPSVNPTKSEVKEETDHGIARADKPSSIRVTELPPLPLGKDWMDRAAWFAGMVLVVVGVLGISLANRTLKAVERQADEIQRQRIVMTDTLSAVEKETTIMKGQLDAMKSSGEQTDKLIAHSERQADLIKRQVEMTEPRLHIDGVRAENFEEGKMPIFYVRIMNSGVVAAGHVAISINVEIGGGITVRYLNDQVIAVPASDWRECFISAKSGFHRDQLVKYDSSAVSLRVSGQVKWSKQIIDYCYKYNPCPSGARPPGLPFFVPCDFETGVNVAIEIPAATLTMAGGIPNKVKIEQASPPEA